MTSCGLNFLNNLLQGFIFHLFEDLGFHVSLLKLLASFEGHKVFLAHIKEGILVVNRLISKLIFNHVSNGLGVLDLRTQGNIVVLVTLELIIERVEYVLLYNLGRHRQTPQIISTLGKNISLSRFEFIYFQRFAINCLLHLLVSIVTAKGRLRNTRLVILS